MYIEASGRSAGKKATMVSTKYRGLKAQCLSFYYHMYGTHVGTLNIYTSVCTVILCQTFSLYFVFNTLMSFCPGLGRTTLN
jgi:hypothetical protein